jgi:hypothetical protein
MERTSGIRIGRVSPSYCIITIITGGMYGSEYQQRPGIKRNLGRNEILVLAKISF